jgi:Fe-S-cluster containining protein
LDFCLDRRAPFSFSCRACGRCCAGKIIMAGPHEVLGMSRLLGISTTEFLARYSDHGGTTLRFGADGRCAFLTAEGCRVHPRRPLVCRLYPLGRATDATGDEKFALFPKQADCEAEFGTDGTIAAFLESQGVAPYIEWSRRYGELYKRMLGLLDQLDIQGKVEASEAGGPGDGAGSRGPGPADEADRSPLSSWQDIDASLAEFCAEKRLAVPAGIEAAIDLHLRAMAEWLDDLEAKASNGPAGEGGEDEGERKE